MDRWWVSSVAVLISNLVLTLATRAQEAVPSSAYSVVVGSAVAAERADGPVGSLWTRRLPKDAAQHARRKELARRYRQAGAIPQFLDRVVGGDVLGALRCSISARMCRRANSIQSTWRHGSSFRRRLDCSAGTVGPTWRR